MKRRPVFQRMSTRMHALRRRRIHNSIAETWDRLRAEARNLRRDAPSPNPDAADPETRAA